MKRFRVLDIETSSGCNRTCPTCIRNSHPNREALAPWFRQTQMPMEMIKAILDQAAAACRGLMVCLSHYNEPLMDPRIVEIAKLVKSYGKFRVYFCTNGDLLTRELASALDGVLDRITVSLYLPVGATRRAKKVWFRSLFSKTILKIKGEHACTHFATTTAGMALAKCDMGRLIINHRGQYLPCCEDVIGNFYMGEFPAVGLKEYWHSSRHREMVRAVMQDNDTSNYPYCQTCPRF